MRLRFQCGIIIQELWLTCMHTPTFYHVPSSSCNPNCFTYQPFLQLWLSSSWCQPLNIYSQWSIQLLWKNNIGSNMKGRIDFHKPLCAEFAGLYILIVRMVSISWDCSGTKISFEYKPTSSCTLQPPHSRTAVLGRRMEALRRGCEGWRGWWEEEELSSEVYRLT